MNLFQGNTNISAGSVEKKSPGTNFAWWKLMFEKVVASVVTLSHQKKTDLLYIESWLVTREPYFMVYYYNLHITE